MKLSFFRRLIENRNLSRDQFGILLLFAFGVTGQLIVFLIPDPLWFLAPQIPMLTPQDWPGSHINTKLFFTDNWRTSASAPRSPFPWEEKRGFFQSLYLSQDTLIAFIEQTIVWYASPGENANVWNQLDPDTYNGWPILERSMDTSKPVSFLACNPDLFRSPPQCWYLVYWEHWFTGVFFWGQSDEDLLMQDIHQLTARVDQLLMSAPDEPCFWFLCTNSNEVRNRNQE